MIRFVTCTSHSGSPSFAEMRQFFLERLEASTFLALAVAEAALAVLEQQVVVVAAAAAAAVLLVASIL